jgi:dTDP-4-dehydrorhamnose reductase
LKVLVTGTQGQLAQSLCEAAMRRGDAIVAAGRPDLDLAAPATIERAIVGAAPDLVVSAGAYTAVDKAESESAVAHAVNGDGAGAVAAACAKAGVPVIHISTDYVFDGCKAEPYRESDATGPLNVYGRSKLEGERQVAANCARHIIVRTSWVYSPFGHNFVKTMLKMAQTRPEVGVVADQVGNPTYAPHLAEAVLAIADRLVADPERDRLAGIYNAAGQGAATWFVLAEEVFRCSRSLGGPSARVRPIATSEYPTPAARPASSRLDCTKLHRVFGIGLPPWEAGVRDCVARLVRPAAGATEGTDG